MASHPAGQYFQPVTPPTSPLQFAALCGITLAFRDGHVLAEALKKPAESVPTSSRASKSCFRVSSKHKSLTVFFSMFLRLASFLDESSS